VIEVSLSDFVPLDDGKMDYFLMMVVMECTVMFGNKDCIACMTRHLADRLW